MTLKTITNDSILANKLIEKLNKKTAVIGVVGLGYVGLPLAVVNSKSGYNVIGFDIQQQRVDDINKGINYIGDVKDNELLQVVNDDKLIATTDYSLISKVDAVIL